MPADPLTAIVRSLDLAGGVFLKAEFTAPWAISARVSEEDCKPFMPTPRQVIAYHVVTDGEMVVDLLDGGLSVARSGDVVFLPSNARHVIASEPGLRPVLGDELVLPANEGGLAQIKFGGGGARTGILCGFIASNAGPNPLLNTLPKSLVIGIEDIATRKWIEASITMAARELTTGRVASASVVTQLSELLLVEALRSYLEREKQPHGWLAGMADPKIARALVQVHEDLSKPASVEGLAKEAGMSRSAFIARFTNLTGQSPRRYVLLQRMEAARLLLRDTNLAIAEIANRIGYEAPEAFSRGFKRETGQSPAEWRTAGRNTASAGDHDSGQTVKFPG